MTNSGLDIGRPSVNVPTPEQAGATTQTVRTKRAGRTTSGASTDNLTVERESASPQYEANVAVGGPKLPAPSYMDTTDLMATLFSLRKKQTESSIESAEQRIHDRAVDKDLKSKEMITKLQKIARKSTNVGSILTKVFSWVGVGLSFVVAAVVGVLSGGVAAAPLLMIAAASAALLIAQQSGGMEKAMDAMGMDDKAKMGFSLGMTALMLVVNIVAVVASGGASAVGVAAEVAEASTEVAATTGEVAASAGGAAAEAAAEVSTSVTEAAVEAGTQATEATVEATVEISTKATEAAVEASTQATEVSVEASTQATEVTVEASTQATEVSVEASTQATEVSVEASTQATEVSVEASTQATEASVEASTQATEATVKTTVETGTKATESATKTAANAGTKSARVMQIAGKVRSGVSVAQGVTEVSTGGITIDSSVKNYEATKARAGAMRDKAALAKMQAQDEEDMRQIRNMIERLESAQTAVMSTISRSDEVSLQIRQNI